MMYGDKRGAHMSYTQFMNAENRADQCVACGQCEEACPQQIKIIDWLKQVHPVLMESES